MSILSVNYFLRMLAEDQHLLYVNWKCYLRVQYYATLQKLPNCQIYWRQDCVDFKYFSYCASSITSNQPKDYFIFIKYWDNCLILWVEGYRSSFEMKLRKYILEGNTIIVMHFLVSTICYCYIVILHPCTWLWCIMFNAELSYLFISSQHTEGLLGRILKMQGGNCGDFEVLLERILSYIFWVRC